MGQYWKPVNLDKKESLHAHELDGGLKIIEQFWNRDTASALVILLAAKPNMGDGGGDFDMDEDRAKDIVGRWAGDRIAFVSDYGEDQLFTVAGKTVRGVDLYHYSGEQIDGWIDISHLVKPLMNAWKL